MGNHLIDKGWIRLGIDNGDRCNILYFAVAILISINENIFVDKNKEGWFSKPKSTMSR